MRAIITAVVAAIEAIAIALAGLALVVVPALLLWVFTFELAADPSEMLGSAVSVWFLAHAVPLEFVVTSEAAVGLGLPQQAFVYPLSLAPLGLTLVTAVLAVRSGWRFGQRGGIGIAGTLGGCLGFAAVAVVIAPSAGSMITLPLWVATLITTAVYAAGSAGGFIARAARDSHQWWESGMRGLQRGIEKLGLSGSSAFPARAFVAVRMATASLAALCMIAACAFTVALLAGYVQIVTLSQSLQLDPIGAFALFTLQLALLPVCIIWSASWLTGAGFAVGAGSSATPFEALLGPVPALPIFGAIPQGWGSAGGLAPAIIVLAGVAIGALFARRVPLRRASWGVVMTVGCAVALMVGLCCAGLGTLASGAIGPDRLSDTGVDAWIFGGLAAAEIGVGILLGLAAGRIDSAQILAVLPSGAKSTVGHAQSEFDMEDIDGLDREASDVMHEVSPAYLVSETVGGDASTADLSDLDFAHSDHPRLNTGGQDGDAGDLTGLDRTDPDLSATVPLAGGQAGRGLLAAERDVKVRWSKALGRIGAVTSRGSRTDHVRDDANGSTSSEAPLVGADYPSTPDGSHGSDVMQHVVTRLQPDRADMTGEADATETSHRSDQADTTDLSDTTDLASDLGTGDSAGTDGSVNTAGTRGATDNPNDTDAPDAAELLKAFDWDAPGRPTNVRSTASAEAPQTTDNAGNTAPPRKGWRFRRRAD